MGVKVRGLDELIRDFETLPERARKALPMIVKRGAGNIKDDWRASWLRMESHPTAIPHLVRGIGYDMVNLRDRWRAEIGVSASNSQAPLAHLIAYGTLGHNAPHDAGLHALDAEDPRFVHYVADKAVDLLEERS